MSTLNLLQRIRSDGSVTLVGSTHSAADEDRYFPEEFDFGLGLLALGKIPAKVRGDEIHVEYVNAKAVYKITGGLHILDDKGEVLEKREDLGFHGSLVADSVEIFDAPAVDTERRDALIAEREQAAAEAARVAAGDAGLYQVTDGSEAADNDGENV